LYLDGFKKKSFKYEKQKRKKKMETEKVEDKIQDKIQDRAQDKNNESNNIGAMPDDVSNIIEQLKFISLVKPGQKINLLKKTFCDSQSYIVAACRFFDGETKQKLTTHIKNLISDTSNILIKYKGTPWEQKIKLALLATKVGIENLAKTYSYHPDTLSVLNTCIENIESFI